MLCKLIVLVTVLLLLRDAVTKVTYKAAEGSITVFQRASLQHGRKHAACMVLEQ